MPKHSATKILEWWQIMDGLLSSAEGLNVRRFAKRDDVKVSTKTVHRWLKAFEALNRRPRYDRESKRYYYAGATACLFVRNLSPDMLDAIRAVVKKRRPPAREEPSTPPTSSSPFFD
jgi:hypothetical protein